jgi:hypothetical protein
LPVRCFSHSQPCACPPSSSDSGSSPCSEALQGGVGATPRSAAFLVSADRVQAASSRGRRRVQGTPVRRSPAEMKEALDSSLELALLASLCVNKIKQGEQAC